MALWYGLLFCRTNSSCSWPWQLVLQGFVWVPAAPLDLCICRQHLEPCKTFITFSKAATCHYFSREVRWNPWSKPILSFASHLKALWLAERFGATVRFASWSKSFSVLVSPSCQQMRITFRIASCVTSWLKSLLMIHRSLRQIHAKEERQGKIIHKGQLNLSLLRLSRAGHCVAVITILLSNQGTRCWWSSSGNWRNWRPIVLGHGPTLVLAHTTWYQCGSPQPTSLPLKTTACLACVAPGRIMQLSLQSIWYPKAPTFPEKSQSAMQASRAVLHISETGMPSCKHWCQHWACIGSAVSNCYGREDALGLHILAKTSRTPWRLVPVDSKKPAGPVSRCTA